MAICLGCMLGCWLLLLFLQRVLLRKELPQARAAQSIGLQVTAGRVRTRAGQAMPHDLSCPLLSQRSHHSSAPRAADIEQHVLRRGHGSGRALTAGPCLRGPARRLLAAASSELLSRRPVLLGGPLPKAPAAFRLRSSWIFTISSAVMGLALALFPCCCSIL